MVSRVCEEFGCTPSVAIAEMERDVDGLIPQILSSRAFVRAKQVYDSAKTEADLPAGDSMVALVKELEFAAVRAELEQVKG